MENKEIWIDIKEYEGLYQVSNFGNIKSLRNSHGNNREKILKPKLDRYGYNCVSLYKFKKHKNKTVHRLVAQAFIENPNNLPQINHINEVKTDNRVNNLEWCTNKYNGNYGSVKEKRSLAIIKRNLTYGNHPNAKRVVCDGFEFDSLKACAEYYNVTLSAISHWLKEKYKMPKRFIEMGIKILDRKDDVS